MTYKDQPGDARGRANGSSARPELLFAAHCVPFPPDKGEKIRAYHEVIRLADRYRLHVACFAHNRSEVEAACELSPKLASLYVEQLRPWALGLAVARFAFCGCLNMAYYSSGRMKKHIAQLARKRQLAGGIAYSAVMAQYMPANMPFVLDMQDVDSEKWLQYSESRWPPAVYAAEARRLRQEEIAWGRKASISLFTTQREEQIYRSFATDVASGYMENGVDLSFFDPSRCADDTRLASRRYVVFTGTMDYWPNVDAACWFAHEVLPALRAQYPGLEFLVVGRNPNRAALALARVAGVEVTGAVADVRPYLKHAAAVVVPLRTARGIQNKVLEALAMEKTVLASPAVCATFGTRVPDGVTPCSTPAEFLAGLRGAASTAAEQRQTLIERFDWDRNMSTLLAEVSRLPGAGEPAIAEAPPSQANSL